MIMLFATMAMSAPPKEAFLIHQVVSTFQISIEIKLKPRKAIRVLPALLNDDSNINKGIQAIKIIG